MFRHPFVHPLASVWIVGAALLAAGGALAQDPAPTDQESAAMVDHVRATAGLVGAGVLVIDHDLAFITLISDHIVVLAEGDVVEAGTRLGRVGNTGNARTTPPHLHYGIYAGDGALDPLPRMHAGR